VTDADSSIGTNVGNNLNDVGPNGDVVYWGGGAIFRLRNGVTTQLTPINDSLFNYAPRTDGINVVYQKQVSSQRVYLALHDGTQETFLTGPQTPTAFSTVQPGRDYTVNNGWVAYIADLASTREVWVRAPGGQQTRVTSMPGSFLHALSDDGQVVWESGGLKYWSAAPYSTIVALGRVPGSVIWDQGRFVFMGSNFTGGNIVAELKP